VSARPHSDGVVRVHPPAGAWRRRQKKSHLLQASYRTTNLLSLIGEGERGALDYLIKSRWGAAGGTSQVCPECGTVGTHYWLESRQYWKCRERSCRAQFSIVSGTYLHSSKISPAVLLSVLFHFVEGKNSISARQISGLHDMSHQAAHVFLMKVRDAIRDSMLREPPLTGKIQADAAYFIKYKRPRNVGTGPAFAEKEDEKNAGLNENAKATRFVHPNMHALVVFVQGGADGRRYKLARLKTEGQVNIAELGKKFCAGEIEFTTDEHSGYSLLVGPTVKHYVILHMKEFQDVNKRNTNNAESFFSRMRHAYRVPGTVRASRISSGMAGSSLGGRQWLGARTNDSFRICSRECWRPLMRGASATIGESSRIGQSRIQTKLDSSWKSTSAPFRRNADDHVRARFALKHHPEKRGLTTGIRRLPRLRRRRQTPLATEHFVRQADALNSLVVSEAQFVLEGQNAALLHYKHRFTELLQEVMKLLRGEL
jgi:hypothetical protein